MSDQTSVDQSEPIEQLRVRSPRSAAIAGILFALLMTASMILITSVARAADTEINAQWLEEQSGNAKLALTLIPFAGIAFLWFTGVMRDRLGKREDQFFATVFLGSGLLFLAMIFVWAGVVGAMFGVIAATEAKQLGDDVLVFGFQFMDQILGNYALRMAGVYMLSIGTLWTRTKVMPRWLVIITYVVAIGFVFFANSVREVRFLFPVWVLLVSVYILITNRRQNGQ